MRLLLIEDDRKLAASLTKSLVSQSFAVDHATDGMQGEELACTNRYDVILLDLMLPRQDGWVTCARLREQNILTPILMLTARDDVEDKIRGLDSGADDYLPKPFHVGELVARIRSLARRASHVRTATITMFGLTLDTATHRASREGQDIQLTSKEFALLELFMLNPGRILTREEISEHLWDMNFEPRSNVIESFVKFLRQKIDHGFRSPLIRTIRGSGYMFSDAGPDQ